eukprot:scaffold140_cov247-Pinguiococcus_pyrenoidosus.AAC.18
MPQASLRALSSLPFPQRTSAASPSGRLVQRVRKAALRPETPTSRRARVPPSLPTSSPPFPTLQGNPPFRRLLGVPARRKLQTPEPWPCGTAAEGLGNR